ncbi:hypothetical protein EIN_267880 [Entamoeba invadens IP1]|uniref:Uncharacterized protein n=2 Tax=Entamoeba invadens TaxID=33085 RepID=A0A0A1UBK3_ENTIV|nr:hypothetical protein EIN_267880 [Entamoeba invadens IP1]ELP91052.1 hypothetical protein EIN_267880 [Entamoeba invadens IP1]BAN41400.1 hypothetical protein [Entamoeba invadens]BAN41881.1 hypothetical protein [Entamoeba invadens]|eukprot:XP_004257823.1 hypothetical protein EIN_267880 [Entamoeba invadens IP1]
MHKILAYAARYGTPVCLTAAGVFSLITIIVFGFGMPNHTFDKKTNTNLLGNNSTETGCSSIKLDHTTAMSYKIPGNNYHYQCGYSVLNDILTWVFEFLCVVEVVLFWVFVIVWRKKKVLTFVVYCCLILPLIMQCYLVFAHSNEIINGTKACKKVSLFPNNATPECSSLVFAFTPVSDVINILLYIAAICLGSVMYFCRPKISKLLDGNEGGDMKKELVDPKAKKEEVEDPIQDMKNVAKKTTTSVISGAIDFSKLGGN